MEKTKFENKHILTYEQTDRLKGLLIILIVLGHIGQLFTVQSQSVLYAFHITTFLFLPFLFNNDKLTIENIKKTFKRYFIPYSIFFAVSLLVFTMYLQNEFDPMSTFIAWLIGSGPLLRGSIGFSVYWFFPALIFLLVLIMVNNTLSLTGRKIFFYLMIVAHFFIPMLPGEILQYFPFGSYVALYLFIVGLVIKYIFYHYPWRNIPQWIVIMTFIIALVAVYGSKFNLASPLLSNIISMPFDFILHDFIMISGFFSMILLSEKINFFEWFGRYSIAIYTVHPFVIKILDITYNWTTFLEGFIKFILVLMISCVIAKGVYVIGLNRILYPR